MRAGAVALCVCVCVWGARAEGEHAAVWGALSAPAVYSVQSTVLLNAAERRDRDLGYRLEGELSVAPDPQPDGDLLLHFTLSRCGLLTRGAHRSAEWEPRGSGWAAGGPRTWAARARGGLLRALLLPPAPPDEADYMRALTALFQYRADAQPGTLYNETDVSGDCRLVYETLEPTHFRKIKRACSHDGAGVQARRAARYTVVGGALAALHAEEVVTWWGHVKARSWHAVARTRGSAAPAPHALPAHLAAAPLSPSLTEDTDPADRLSEASDAVELYGGALDGEPAGAGGTAASAHLLLRLLPALRAAPRDSLLRLLREPRHRARLPALCRALGLAGSPAAVAAAREFLRVDAADPLEPLARAFLAGFTAAPSAPDAAVRAVLRLAEDARRATLAEAALLAAAGAARSADLRAAVRDAATRGIQRCADAACRAPRLLALGNARVDAADLLLRHAETDEGAAAGAALSALGRTPALSPAQLTRLVHVALNTSRAVEVRAAALELAVGRAVESAEAHGAVPVRAAELARALAAERGEAAHELRRVLWQRLEALEGLASVRALRAVWPRELRAWDARAHGGTSSVLARDAGWGARGASLWRAELHSAQVAAAGVLRRGTVALRAVSPDNETTTELEVSVWVRGLGALAGGGGGGGEEEGEEAGGGLALSVGGARLPDVPLFSSQAELLGHVWAGTGAAPGAVLRAARVPPAHAAALPLLCGGVLRARAAAAAELALDAHATASLWHRTARAALRLRAGLAAAAGARITTAWADLRANLTWSAEPRLRIALDLDFYDQVALCVRADTPDHDVRRSLRLESVSGARVRRVLRGSTLRWPAAGRTLSLGRASDTACRTLRAEQEED